MQRRLAVANSTKDELIRAQHAELERMRRSVAAQTATAEARCAERDRAAAELASAQSALEAVRSYHARSSRLWCLAGSCASSQGHAAVAKRAAAAPALRRLLARPSLTAAVCDPPADAPTRSPCGSALSLLL